MPEPRFVSINPEVLATIQLEDCLAELESAKAKPVRVLLSAKALHGALVAALTAALAGSAGVGAYEPKMRERFLSFLQNNRQGLAELPMPLRVMQVSKLLERACEPGGIEWRLEPLVCSERDRELIDKLTFIRDDLEHPKPILNSFEAAWVLEAFPVAVRLTLECLEAVQHHLEEDELQRLQQIGRDICSVALDWGRPRFG